MNKSKIDFVIPWVDGNDKKWQKEKSKFDPNKDSDARNIRYRDWENLKFWFRGVEKFAPWVNKIYFITCGHLPDWLDTKNEKLIIVKHEDYIPKEFLPIFSSHPIELNLHRIKGLSEQFVYFNDDLFILKNIKSTDFFIDDKPCGEAVFNPPGAENNFFLSILYNNNLLINKHFSKKEIWKKNKFKYFNYKYGKDNLRTILCLPWNRIQGFKELHGPVSLLKKTYFEVWEAEEEALIRTSMHKFRNAEDINQYVFKNWQFCSGDFVPSKLDFKFISIQSEYKNICEIIEKQKHKIVCLNDDAEIENFEEVKNSIILSLEKILPEKSSFEK